MSKILYNPINNNAIAAEIGAIGKVGGFAISNTPITSDVELPEIAMLFRIGDPTAGKTLILEGADGNPVPFANLATGEEIFFLTKKIIYQATIDAVLYTTDVILLSWIGGQ